MKCRNFESLGLVAPHEASAANWIEGCLKGPTGEVTRFVPAIFQDYARIFHPASTPEGYPRKWEEVARELGRTMHPLVQWHSLVGLTSPFELPSSEWPGSPEVGLLPPETLRPLCGLLPRHTDTPEQCFFGFLTGQTTTSTVSSQAASTGERNGIWVEDKEEEDVSRPEFSLPPDAGRDYVLWVGPVRAAVAVVELDSLSPVSPNLFWPSDRAWFLNTDVDLDSTLIGGSRLLIDELLTADDLEVRRLGPRDSVAFDADRLNKS